MYLCKVVARVRILVQLLRQRRQPSVRRNRLRRRLWHLQRRKRPVRRQRATLHLVARQSTDTRACSCGRRRRRLRPARRCRGKDLSAPREAIDPAWRAPCGAVRLGGARARASRTRSPWPRRNRRCFLRDGRRHFALRLVSIEPRGWWRAVPRDRRRRRWPTAHAAPWAAGRKHLHPARLTASGTALASLTSPASLSPLCA